MAKITAIAYLNGTRGKQGLPTSGHVSFINVLFELTKKITIGNDIQLPMCQSGPGCGDASHSKEFGGVFADLTSQITSIVENVKKMILKNHEVDLILPAFSRGNMAAFESCILLKDIDPAKLRIHLVALDPVPGNLSTTANVTGLMSKDSSWAAKIADLSQCKNISSAMFLFSSTKGITLVNSTKLNNIASDSFNAILPVLPEKLYTDNQVFIDVLPGTHGDLNKFELSNEKQVSAKCNSSIMGFHAVANYLQKKCQVKFDFEKLNLTENLNLANTKNLMTVLMAIENSQIKDNSTKAMHYGNEIKVSAGKAYLNKLHAIWSGVPGSSNLGLMVGNMQPTLKDLQETNIDTVANSVNGIFNLIKNVVNTVSDSVIKKVEKKTLRLVVYLGHDKPDSVIPENGTVQLGQVLHQITANDENIQKSLYIPAGKIIDQAKQIVEPVTKIIADNNIV